MMASVNERYAVETPRKRRRPPLSCTECRRRKVKCDRKQPCSHCILWLTTCHYVDTPSRPTSSVSSENREVRGSSNRVSNRSAEPDFESTFVSGREILEARPSDVPLTAATSGSHASRQLDHIQNMLDKLISGRNLQPDTNSFVPTPPNSLGARNSRHEYDQPRLQLNKSKLFGSTHWSGASHIVSSSSQATAIVLTTD
jgi:hypothetical protein